MTLAKLATVCAFTWALLCLKSPRFANVQRRLSGISWARTTIGHEMNL